MCEVSYEERCTIWSETTPLARKLHLCDCCGGSIAKGERYTSISLLSDLRWFREKECAACSTVAAAYQTAHGMRWSPSQMRIALSDCVDYEGAASEDGKRWTAAIAAMDLRGTAVRERAEVITEER